VDPIPDPQLLRKSGSAGNQTRVLWICSQDLTTRIQRRSYILNRMELGGSNRCTQNVAIRHGPEAVAFIGASPQHPGFLSGYPFLQLLSKVMALQEVSSCTNSEYVLCLISISVSFYERYPRSYDIYAVLLVLVSASSCQLPVITCHQEHQHYSPANF
jgi:hypothetical protein